jgi:outer membrane protein
MKKIISLLITLTYIQCAAAYASSDAPLVIDRIGPVTETQNKTYDLFHPLTLADCYHLALKQSETIAINESLIRQAEARFLQAMSIMMPYFSFQSRDMQEAIPNDEGTTFSTLKPAKSSERQFQVKQVLFSGFKAIAAMSGSKLERQQRAEEKLRAQQLLLVDVSDAFYLVIEKRDDFKALLRIRAALLNRIKELKFREDLGRSRPSEVVNAKAQLYTVEADLKVVRSQETVARQLLEFLIGMPVQKLSDSYKIPDSLMAEEYYVMKFMNRPDIKALEYAWKFSEKQLDVVNSDFLPTVSWQGNFYTQRTAFDKGTDWDVMLNVSVPIFSGTEILGKSREYRLKAQENELRYIRLKRLAPYDIKDSYVRCDTALAVHENLKKAFYTAKVNYYLQRRDYTRSLVSNLDVLAAIQTLQDSQRNYIRAIYEAKRLYWQLRVSVGEGIEEALNDTV